MKWPSPRGLPGPPGVPPALGPPMGGPSRAKDGPCRLPRPRLQKSLLGLSGYRRSHDISLDALQLPVLEKHRNAAILDLAAVCALAQENVIPALFVKDVTN